MSEITMPKLSDSMEEGTILKWLKADGQPIARDEDLVEIETDKATMTCVSEFDGTLQIVAPEGTTLPVGTVIARVGVATADAADVDVADREAVGAGRAMAEVGDSNGGDPVGALTGADAPLATPLARRAAQAHSVDLGGLRGTGPRGRITRGDVFAAAGVAGPAPPAPRAVADAPSVLAAAPPPEDGPPPGGGPSLAGGSRGEREIQEPTRLQQVIARRMAEAKATIPEFEVQTEVAMDEAIALRARLEELAADGDPVPSINDFVIKACAVALRHHPRVNASYENGQFLLHRRVNVGFAVARDDALIVPTLNDADTLTLGAIARKTRLLAHRVRSGEITPPELSGATFTVSNLGMFGMTAIRPVINPPQAAILGVGAMREVLARVDGEIVDRTVMTLTLSSDHRILYGADAARFLAEVRAGLESPLRIAL